MSGQCTVFMCLCLFVSFLFVVKLATDLSLIEQDTTLKHWSVITLREFRKIVLKILDEDLFQLTCLLE